MLFTHHINKLILGLILMLSFTGCVKLEEDLTGRPTADKFFKNTADFNSFMAGAYAPITVLYSTDNPYVAGAGAEDVHTLVGRWKGFEQGNINAVGNPSEITDPIWNAHYTSISVCNNTIKIVAVSPLPGNTLAPFNGEARFLRALNYFYLVRWFGEVPIITENNMQDAGTTPQNTINEVYKFIVADLTQAENELPAMQTDKTKPNKWAAKALLAKVYLTMAGFPLNQVENYALARDKAKEVMDANVYSLTPNFGNLWLWSNRLSNQEFIFTLYANAVNGTGGYVNRAIRPYDHGEGGWGDWESDKRFLAKFPQGDGSRVNGTFYLTMIDGTSWDKTDYAQPYVGKLRDGGVNSNGYTGPPIASIFDGFYVMLRYSDVLLVYAETSNMAEGTPSAGAYNAINLVRSRAGLTALSGLDHLSFDKAVVDERNWEFAFENNRWFDIYRKHLLKEVIAEFYPTVNIDDHNYLLPKPIGQLAIMKGVKQNPGY